MFQEKDIRYFVGVSVNLLEAKPIEIFCYDSLMICWVTKEYNNNTYEESILGINHYSFIYNFN